MLHVWSHFFLLMIVALSVVRCLALKWSSLGDKEYTVVYETMNWINAQLTKTVWCTGKVLTEPKKWGDQYCVDTVHQRGFICQRDRSFFGHNDDSTKSGNSGCMPSDRCGPKCMTIYL